ncbi:UV DNA damage repair endonuclease UvsE [Nafulsella turpanensis]|uniref:UV DNA damage repair endonuclease UvsE n=1 Tax=Nafulsella turpanensis TaxID=1265690 RepID=UPI00034AD09A|nr:UV DNA damage repair endonuclease UvsE [Nafulsella turpanensis]
MRIGYACLNTALAEEKISVNRGMIRKTFLEKGLSYTGELIIRNLQDLLLVLRWNQEHDILFYRLSSSMFPWMSEYELEELPQFSQIAALLKEAGEFASSSHMRLSFHPGPFNVLASEKPDVVQKTVKELDQHAAIMNLMQLSATPFHKINIHVGSSLQGNKEQALQNFCKNYQRLQSSTKARLTVENDDKPNMFSTGELYEGIHKKIGIPLVFDYHHHFCHPGGQSQEEALMQALGSWPEGIRPIVHYSEPKSLKDRKLLRAHSDYIERRIPSYGREFDIMIEAKQKEEALLRYRELQKNGMLKEPLPPLPVETK